MLAFVFSFFLGVIFTKIINTKVLQKILNTFLIYVGLPVLTFIALQKSGEITNHVFIAIILWLTLTLIGYALFYKEEKKEIAASSFFCAVYSNMGYFGIPLAYSFFGSAGAAAAAVFVLVEMIVHNTLGIFLSQRIIGKEIISFGKIPFLWMILLAIALSFFIHTTPPYLNFLSNVTVYLTPFVVGLTFTFGKLPKMYWKSSILRFIVSPILFAICAIIFNQNILLYTLLGILPPATTNVILAIALKYDEKSSASFVSYTSAIFFIVLGIISLFVTVA